MKKFFLTSFIIVGIMSLSGCEKDGKNSGMQRENIPDVSAVTEYVMQEGDTQIVGEVTQIIGNEVTLAVGELIESDAEDNFPEMPSDADRPQRFDMGNGEAPQMPQGKDMPQIPDGGFPNMGGGELPDMNGGKATKFQGGGRKTSASVEKSGETGKYIIPVGMTVSGASGRNNDYSAISAGMILRLTISSDGYTAAAEIL